MPFIHVGSAAESVMAGVCGDNVLPFPQDSEITRDKIISRSCVNLELSRDVLLRVCGVTGTARILVLMLEEMIEANSGDVVESDKLSKKISRLAKVFSQEPERPARIESSG
jgi:hypothetical protein